MSSETFQTYRHSGKFGVHGPILAIVAAVALGWPLGIAYAYLIRWIPFIYVNFLATLGYGFVFGLMASVLLKMAKVRNNPVAWLVSLLWLASSHLYFAWSGFIRCGLIRDGPWFYRWAEVCSR